MLIQSICCTCLSAERKLTRVTDIKHNAIYSDIFNKLTMDDMNICWECRALFVNMYKFKSQVLRAQQIIKGWADQKPKQISSLSTLSTHTKTTYDAIYVHDIQTEIAIDSKTSNIETEITDTHTNYVWSHSSIRQKDFDSTKTNTKRKYITINENTNTSAIGDSCSETKVNDSSFDIDDIKIDRVASDEYKKRSKKGFNVEKFVVIKLSEEEMLLNRERDRDSSRYRACTYKCEKCIMGYYDEQKYKKHIKDKHSEHAGKHVCPICETRFSRRDHHEGHVRAHYRGFRCKLCAFVHHRAAALAAHHAREHEQETKYVCLICQHVSDNKRSLRYHRDKAHRELPKCQLCDKTFSSSASLKTHAATHAAGAAAHRCASCARTYRSAASLRAHVRSHGGARAELAYCAPCDAQFRHARLYARHLAEHRAHADTRTLKFACAHCGARFANKAYLSRHVSCTHLKIYPHACHLCHKRFAARDRLKSHILEKHEGVPKPKDKICTYCGRGFAKRSTLINHQRVHTGERPFSCGTCGASFAQKSALATHMRALHAGAAPALPNTDTAT